MLRIIKTQRGQALILIAVAILALVAIVGLAVDGGSVFSDRRHAQNAADAAALAAALAKTNGQDWQTAGLGRALDNGYRDDTVNSTITVNNPPVADDCDPDDAASPYLGNSEYVQVIIQTNVDTYFAPVVGVDQLHNCVEAIAHAKPGVNVPLFYGNAIAATSCTASPGIDAGGSANVITIGGGAFSNSSGNPCLRIKKDDNLITPTDKGLSCAGGTFSVPGTYPSPAQSNPDWKYPCPLPAAMLPQYTCDYNYVNFPPSGMSVVPAGTYCISGTFSKANLTGTDVAFVLLNQGISWNGNAALYLSAPSSGPMRGMLIYLPPSNSSEIKLNGTFDMATVGSIFAPSSKCTLLGDFSAHTLHSQWICNTLDLTGNVGMTIEFSEGENYQYSDPARIEIVK